MSVRARLTFWYTTMLGVPLVALAVVSYLALNRALLHRTDNFLTEALATFATELVHEGTEMPTGALAIRAAISEMQFEEMQVLVFDSASNFIATGERVRGPLGLAVSHERAAPVDIRVLTDSLRTYRTEPQPHFEMGSGNNAYRVQATPISLYGVAYRVVGAYPLLGIKATMSEIQVLYLVAIPILLLVAAGGGYQLAKRSLAPVSTMRARALGIGATNLHERLPVDSPNDELGDLAKVVNGLLARLEQAFVHQRQFMADASHELRTPVAILRTEVEVTLSREHRDEQDYRQSLVVMSDAAQRLTRIVEDLFLLSRADSGHLTPRFEPLYLEEVVQTAERAERGMATRRGLRLELVSVVPAPFEGDADLLGRLLLNLLDNAIKFSKPNGVVQVSLAEVNGFYEIAVTDDGPGIPAEARDRIFDRFFRVDVARSHEGGSGTGGAGLGLSIARWVAESHGGTIQLAESRAGRTRFLVKLPVDPGLTHLGELDAAS